MSVRDGADLALSPAAVVTAAEPPAPGAAPLPAGARFWPTLAAVHRAQLARVRVSRIPLLFVATFQSVGIMLLLRGVVDPHDATQRADAVAGAAVTVVAFVALNLLAQHFGSLRASRALDYYATLPAPPAAIVLGVAAAYAAFTVPGTLVTAAFGALLFGLSLGQLWLLLVITPILGAALAGVGALLGLLAPKQELATLAGQLGMSAVLFLGIIPARRLPTPLLWVRDALPSSYAVDALASALRGGGRGAALWSAVGWRLGVCAGAAFLALAAASWAFRRTVAR